MKTEPKLKHRASTVQVDFLNGNARKPVSGKGKAQVIDTSVEGFYSELKGR